MAGVEGIRDTKRDSREGGNAMEREARRQRGLGFWAKACIGDSRHREHRRRQDGE